MKSVSAIVVNWNDRKATAECVRSLQSQDHESVEIIVCDNGSYDGSASLLKQEFPDVRVIELEENLGFGPAVNQGLTVATGEHLVFLNNDLVLAPDCLRQMSQALEGDRDIIFNLFKKIALDERHTSVDLTYDEPITTRMFPYWSIGFHLIHDSNASSIEGFSLFLQDGFKDNSIEIKKTLVSTFLLNFKEEVT